jgi:micrococcal nuclease
LTGVVLVVASSLAVLALLAFAVSLVVFLYHTSRHRSSRGWAFATGAFLVLVLLFGTVSNTASRHSGLTLNEDRSNVPSGAGQTDQDATVKVTRVVDGDTIDISPSVEGRSRVRLIGMDTPEVHFGTQPYGPEASAFAKQELNEEEVGLELDVQKIDPYGRLLAYVYLPDGDIFNVTLVEEGYAQVATFPPNVKYQDRFLEAQREAREDNRGLWGLSAAELCQQTDRDNAIGGDAQAPRLNLQRRLSRPVLRVGEISTSTAPASKQTRRHRGFSSKTRTTRTTLMETATAWHARNCVEGFRHGRRAAT